MGAYGKIKSPLLHFPHMSNLLAHYVKNMDTPPTNSHIYLSYTI
jgi:hypothetical protein